MELKSCRNLINLENSRPVEQTSLVINDWYKLLNSVLAILLNSVYFFQLIKKLPNLNEKNKEKPLCYTYSIKARAIIHAHLSRIPLNPNTLEIDRRYIIGKCPYLINEQVNCVNQLIMLAYAKRSKCYFIVYLGYKNINRKTSVFFC